MPFLGEFLALFSAFLWAFAVILFRRLGAGLSPLALNLGKNSIAIVLMIPTIILVHGWAWPAMSAWDFWMLFFSGVLGMGIADTLYFVALNRIGASRTGIAAGLYSPAVVIFSIFWLGEVFLPGQWLGLALVLAGVMLVSYKPEARDVEHADLLWGIGAAVLSVIVTALSVVAVKPILETTEFMWSVQIRLLGGVAAISVIAAIRRRNDIYRKLWEYPDKKVLGIASFLGTWMAMIAFIGGYRWADASVASVLNETANVFIVILAWLMLKERLNPRKVTGITCTFIGVAIMLLLRATPA